MDSDADADDDDDDRARNEPDDADVKQENGKHLSPEDARKQGELADGVQRIKVCCFNQIFLTNLLTNPSSSASTLLS